MYLVSMFFLIPLITFTIFYIYKEYTDPIKEPTKEELEERARRLKERFSTEKEIEEE